MSENAEGTTLELILVRHAKSDWGDPSQPDHDRPLNHRGLGDAPVMARRLAEAGIRPDRILSSTALRARTTAAEFGREAGVEVELVPELYASTASTLARWAAGSGVRTVMLAAHNPGITDLAHRASSGGIAHMPTCAVARFVWHADDWAAIDWNGAESWALDTPR